MCPATLLVDPMNASEPEVRAAGEAAVAAGFDDASVWAFQLGAFDGVGLRIAAVEAVMAWAGTDDAAAEAEVEQFTSLVQTTGATMVLACTMEPEVADFDVASRHLRALAERLESLGARVCLEFLPWSGVPDLATAWRLIEPLPASAGITLDMWHWQRQPGGPNPTLLASIPGERIGYVQLCDVPAEAQGDALSDAMANRLLPGDGVVDFAEVLGILSDTGATPFYATEIFNPSLVAEHGHVQTAVAMREAALRVLGPETSA
jgi:sugar phosphate isomerase/epimerase